ncbi:MAG: efflux RND transporter periplasmic adaptor subunit, partial [Deltaproteobacteria bacterium]|nr:efflux RND transporter periplasmic adaptor subunit [Deltaproteobacteria bacterium]
MASSSARRWRLALLGGAAALALLLGGRALLGPKVPVWIGERRELVQRVVASGRVLAPARIQIGSVVIGRATRVPLDKGDRVKPLDLLVQLDDVESRAALAQARSAVAQAAARFEQVEVVSARVTTEAVRQAELRLAQAELKLTRNRTLAEAGSVSRSDLDDALQARDLAASQLASARIQASAAATGADRHVAQAALEQARGAEQAALARLDQLQIRSPAAGVVTERDVEPGDVVQPGRALLVVARDGPTQLSVLPDEKNLAFLRLGQAATASVDAFPDRVFSGEIDYTGSAMDEQTRTLKVRATVNNEEALLRPGMFCEVQVLVAVGKETIAIPKVAVLSDEGNDFVFRHLKDDYYVRRAVKKGRAFDGSVEILDGLKVGETIISDGSFLLKS